MKWAVVIASGQAETIHNALRLASLAASRGQEVSVFMLGLAVDFERLSNEQFDLAGQAAAFQDQGDFYV